MSLLLVMLHSFTPHGHRTSTNVSNDYFESYDVSLIEVLVNVMHTDIGAGHLDDFQVSRDYDLHISTLEVAVLFDKTDFLQSLQVFGFKEASKSELQNFCNRSHYPTDDGYGQTLHGKSPPSSLIIHTA